MWPGTSRHSSRAYWGCWPGSLIRGAGVGHRLAGILGLALCAVVAGARSFTAIAEWAADADEQTLRMLGVTGAVPSELTFRRTLQRLDADAFDDLAGAWAQQATMPGPKERRVIAVDGKTLRGSASGGEPGDHLLAALDHAHGAVLGQADVGAKTNEIPMFPVLLDRIDVTGAVITADAMHAQRGHATYLAGRGDDTCERGHGRAERRTLKITAVAAGLAFPHAAQAIQIVRRRKLGGKTKWSRETVYAVTSLTAIQASPAGLAAIIRGHQMIGDRLHWVRDMDYDEDRSQVRTASAPRVMATLRNLALTILRLNGRASIAAALRHHARRPGRPLRTIMNC